jgi:hypothetical protein
MYSFEYKFLFSIIDIFNTILHLTVYEFYIVDLNMSILDGNMLPQCSI